MEELPNLLQLRAFVRVAELGSITQAAQRLFRAQSVVTRAIAGLERQLAVPLFERETQGMRLSGPGQGILPRARRVFAELAQVPRRREAGSGEPLYLMQTRRLQLFASLCQSGHMPSVARQFGVSQPAVSAALKALEQGCGQVLFDRSPHGLRPTVGNAEVALPIRRALNELRHLLADLHAERGEVRGVVRIGALPLGRTRLLPDAIVQVTRRHPHLRVVTDESPFEHLALELRSGDVDFIFGALRPADAGDDLESEALLTEQLVILARADHPLAAGPATPESLASAGWILPRQGSPSRALVEESFRNRGLPAPVAIVESGDLAIIRGVLRGSDLLAAVSAHQLQVELEAGTLCQLAVLGGSARPLGLIYRKNALPSPAAAAFMQALREGMPQRRT